MIKKWHVKALVQKVVSFLPFDTKINYFLQRHFGNVDLSDKMFTFKVRHADNHVRNFKERREIVPDLLALELGTGWYPVVPISLFLAGFDRVISIDMHDWLSPRQVLITIRKFADWREQGKLDGVLSTIQPDRWQALLELLNSPETVSLEELCGKFNFHPQLADARRLESLADNSVDLVCSNNTFEHIPEQVLKDILLEFKRVVKRDGVMSHHIDLTDHYSHFDPSINQYHFLTLSDRQWWMANNSLAYQNRLRWKDYRMVYESVGLPYQERNVLDGKPEQIVQDRLAPRFKSYSREELAIMGGYFVS